FCKEYEGSTEGWTTRDPRVIAVRKSLAILRDWLQSHFGSFCGRQFEVKESEGAGWFPRVPWVCVLPPKQSVSSGVYFALCFSRNGLGAIAGFAESASDNQGRLNTVIRTARGTPRLD